VLAGEPYRSGTAVEALIGELGIGAHVVRTGPVTQDQLAALYTSAEAFAFPSLMEGFGLPVLEAMNCGVPVVASNASAIPEVVGDAGVLADARDPEAFANALERVLSDPILRADLRHRGLERAQQFSWQRCAEGTLAAYRELA
jgi:glycosyltransferase involved in cell wall biosynthesis